MNNTTQSLEVINDLSKSTIESTQSLLAPLYKAMPLLHESFMGIALDKLLTASLLLIALLIFRTLFSKVIIAMLQSLANRSNNTYDDRIVAAIYKPLRLTLLIVGLHLFCFILFPKTPFITSLLNSILLYAFFSMILDIAEVSRDLFYHATSKLNPDLSREMGNFMLKITKVVIVAIGVGAVLQVWGINVSALIASLGLGGLAFALAAKDTAANLFGSFAILADKSIRIGEWIKVDGVEGVVEDIGMRTTKIRSFKKSLITVPNSIVANAPIENFSRRGLRRISMKVGLTYGTNATQIQTIIEQIKTMLNNHNGIATNETLLVNFESFGDSAINIFIYTFTQTSNWERYLQIRQEVHLEIMRIVEANGSDFAFPSQTIYLQNS